MSSHFDIIIVGAGSAGCALAGRLSELAHLRVLLIEAGPDTPPDSVPDTIRDVYPLSYADTRFHWKDLKARGKTAAAYPPGVLGERRYEQGRVVGGSSSLMGMYAQRGLRDDFEEWKASGLRGWGADETLPYFRKLENDWDFSGPEHGKDGPVTIRRQPADTYPPFCAAVAAELDRRQTPRIEDMNGDDRDGHCAIPMSNTPTQRVSSATAYLTDDVRRRKNLEIWPDCTVTAVRRHGRTITGVEARRGGARIYVNASEVIISAGALHSPAMLMRTGIGPADHLRTMGIEVAANLPGVGQNLQNHPIFYVSAHLRRGCGQPRSVRVATFNSLRFSSGVPGGVNGDMYMLILNKTAFHPLGERIAGLGTAIYKPHSRGHVQLAAASPDHEPSIDFNMLSAPADMARMMVGIRLACGLMTSPAVTSIRHEVFAPRPAEWVRELNSPTARNWWKGTAISAGLDLLPVLRRRTLAFAGTDILSLIDDDTALRQLILRQTLGMFHPVGTCKMGADGDPMAVLDEGCKVRGIEGLRVVDASVMPTIIRGNTNIPTIMIAEKVADVIKRERSNGSVLS